MSVSEVNRAPAARGWRVAWLVVILFPVLVNFPEVANIAKADPLLRYSNLGAITVPGPFGYGANIDPSTGYFFQALGRRSADLLLHGKSVWWNSDEGIGVPLAGELVSAPFYPLTVLEELPNGQTFVDLAVKIFSGVFTLLLLRRLGLRAFPAAMAAMLFECNGTFAWLGAGWCYPFPLLPLLAYGIELTISSSVGERTRGTAIVAISVAVSAAASMIETSYLDGLFCIGYAFARLASVRPGALADRTLRLVLGGVAGVLLSAPLLLAFLDYVKVSFVGMHAAGTTAHLGINAVPQTLLPYIWGSISLFDDDALHGLWGSVGGYSGLAVVIVAACGTVGSRLRALRIYLAVWVVASYGATIGLPLVQQIVDAIPGVIYTAAYRYLDGSRAFALAILAAFFIDELLVAPKRYPARLGVATALVAAVLLYGLWLNASWFQGLFAQAGFAQWFWGSLGAGAATVVVLWALMLVPSARLRAYGIGALLVCEAAAYFFIPTLAFPREGHVDEAAVAFMRKNVGLSRVYTLGPMAPNYGSYYDLAQINFNDIPIATAWTDYVRKRLDPYYEYPFLFTGWSPGPSPGVPSREQAFLDRVEAFEALGVKYVATPPGVLTKIRTMTTPIGAPVSSLPLLAHREVRLRIGSVPAGLVTDVGFDQGNYSNASDGILTLRACAGDDCAGARRPVSESPNNTYFTLHLDRPLLVTTGTLSIDIHQTGAKVSDVMSLFASPAQGTDSVAVDGATLPGQVALVQLRFGSQILPLPAERARGATISLASGETARAEISGDAFPSAPIDAIGLARTGKNALAAGNASVRFCSGGVCAGGRERGAGVIGDILWMPLERPVPIVANDMIVSIANRSNASEQLALQPEAPGLSDSVTVAGKPAPGGLFVALDRVFPTFGRLAFGDELVEVNELPHPAPYFSADGCSLTFSTRDSVSAYCATNATLVRRELALPGWRAEVDGVPHPVGTSGEVFQSVRLPAASSTVTFAFVPPNMAYGYAAFTLGFLIVIYQLVASMIASRRPAAAPN